MNVNNIHYQTIWMQHSTVHMIEQNLLPYKFSIFQSKTHKDTCHAIKTMIVRGAGAIGAAAGYAMAQAAAEAPTNNYRPYLNRARKDIENTRPTAHDLFHAVNRVYNAALESPTKAAEKAEELANANINACKQIGCFGETLIKDNSRIATHCNAGWLAFVDYGSALAPIYVANENKKKVFVYADETRPRSQGSKLTAWELHNQNIEHAIIPDNATAWLMKQGKIDLMIVGADRIATNGDVANKIGTLEKAIAAKYFNIPFYVAAPLSTFDKLTNSGDHINIEERSEIEVHYSTGPDESGAMHTIRISNPFSKAINPAFDVTPANLISGIITEKGIIEPSKKQIEAILINL